MRARAVYLVWLLLRQLARHGLPAQLVCDCFGDSREKLKKAHVFAITALTLCFCGIYGYCDSQRNDYRQKHAEVYTVIGFNFTGSGYGFVPKMGCDKHVFVRLKSTTGYSQRVIMSEHYHVGDTVRIFHNKVI